MLLGFPRNTVIELLEKRLKENPTSNLGLSLDERLALERQIRIAKASAGPLIYLSEQEANALGIVSGDY